MFGVIAELARSNRTKCEECEKVIPMGEIRLKQYSGSVDVVIGTGTGDRRTHGVSMTCYYHQECFLKEATRIASLKKKDIFVRQNLSLEQRKDMRELFHEKYGIKR